ncbi:MAG: hypothetical protein JWO06_4016, partial [Bacteroidota bacterium]|nr:hypothetical protein [Bacteroidota bacterium]
LLPVSSTNSTGELKEDFAGQTTASNNNAGNEFQVLPNPASNEIVTGNAQLPQQNQMLLTDMQGKTVLSVQNIQPAQHLDITQVPAGTYIVQFTGGGQVSNSKIIITH